MLRLLISLLAVVQGAFLYSLYSDMVNGNLTSVISPNLKYKTISLILLNILTLLVSVLDDSLPDCGKRFSDLHSD